MNIVVCVKQVPDTWAERTLRPEDSRLDRASVDGVINELDEYAIEEGLRLAEAHGGEVTVLTMGPEKASESIRKALSMGADKAVHLVDDALAFSGPMVTIHRQADYGYDKVVATMPAVVSVVEKINEPRYPSFKGIMAAKKKPVDVLSVADAAIDPAQVGLGAAATEVVSFSKRPPREAGTIVKDEGDGGAKAAEFLAAQKFI